MVAVALADGDGDGVDAVADHRYTRSTHGSGELRPGVKRQPVRDRNGLEVLSRAECLELLPTVSVGRVALSIGALPVVLPVRFVVDGESVVFRTVSGSKLEAATRQAVVAFEADHIEPADETGWSVLLTGVAHHVEDPVALVGLRCLPLRPWIPVDADHFVRIPATTLTGRRIPPGGHPC